MDRSRVMASSSPHVASNRCASATAAAATAESASARLRADTAALLAGAREDLGSSTQKAVDSAVAALRADGAAAIGVVRVGSTLPLPELPPIQVDWPEPASLLAIPDGDGGFRDWFPEAKTVAGGPRT